MEVIEQTEVKKRGPKPKVFENDYSDVESIKSFNWNGVKIRRLSMHQATNVYGQVKTTLDYKVNDVDMTLLPIGVLCKMKNMKGDLVTRIISLNNVYEMDLFD